MAKHRPFVTGAVDGAGPDRPPTPLSPGEGPFLSRTFKALIKEAEFTKEMLGAGATQIRLANYATKGVYFQAFTSLSTGLERIGKLCLMLDYFIDHIGSFPDSNYMKNQIGHKLMLMYQQSKAIIARRSLSMTYLQDLDNPIYQAIISVLSEFALGDRYSNIDLLVGGSRQNDPVASWFKEVDQPLYQTRVAQKTKEKIENNAAAVESLFGPFTMVLHTSEVGDEISALEEASRMIGVWRAVAPHRQLYVVQIIRYWAELLRLLQYKAMELKGEDIPFLSEGFALFLNDDTYIKTRKTFDRLM
jgi:hypothetical protein